MSKIDGNLKQKKDEAGPGKRPASRFQMKNRELVGSVKKNSREILEVNVAEYQSKVYVDARIFIKDTTDPGAVIATKKGLCLAPDILLKLLPLLSEAQEMAALRSLEEEHEAQ